MKKYILLFILCLGFLGSTNAQSIRKNYKEMTQTEKNALVSAFYQLRTGADLINDLATFHNNNFSAIHNNPPAQDVFLAWHRRQIFEVEQAMQSINPNLSIPFWDWTIDNSTSSDLWFNGFMGQFNSAWSLGRTFNSNFPLPTISQVTAIQNISTWTSYYAQLETSVVHTGAHNWVGRSINGGPDGAMATGASPRDPVFYLHHGMIDKLYDEWITAHGITPSSNIYARINMPRYDGTYSFNGQTLPSVNPDNIVNSKALGVFYATSQLADLTNYTVSNTYRSLENFYYQYTIQAGMNFIVPSGKNAKFESVNQILLKPGFHAQNGSAFLAKIDTDNNIGTSAKTAIVRSNENKKAFDNIVVVENAYIYRDEDIITNNNITFYPNPFESYINIEFKEDCADCSIELFDIQGSRLMQSDLIKDDTIQLEFIDLAQGIYILKVKQGGRVIRSGKIIKN